ncbi:MAG: hydroxymethylglutaryl-CoA reductase [Theionarchaea archaeon]|nr:hydroxymethylglutaryl-CoA reductase [Theionarchaea archaeon]MBU7037099.1 hydroxymethylglutaryl-CoA reductase [Theionarchaea archaeon]
MKVPSFMLKKLYQKGSLKNTENGYQLVIKNNLMDATVTKMSLTVDNKPVPEDRIAVAAGDISVPATQISDSNTVPLNVGVKVTLSVQDKNLSPGEHTIGIGATTKEFGDIDFSVSDTL